jgi:hypothetical protein
MATITKGHTFINGDVLDASNLNNLVDNATISGILTTDISDAQITTAKLADVAVTTAKIQNGAVTFAKMQSVSALSLLGSIAGGAVDEVAILDDDTMSADSAVAVPTQQSVKAYVDNNAVLDFYVATGTLGAGGDQAGSIITCPSGTKFAITQTIYGLGGISAPYTTYISAVIRRSIDGGAWTSIGKTMYQNVGQGGYGSLTLNFVDTPGAFASEVRYQIRYTAANAALLGGSYMHTVIAS